MENTKKRTVSNLILIPWATLSLAVLVYFFCLCSLYIDDFFPYVISRLPLISITFLSIMITITATITGLFMFKVFANSLKILKAFNYVFLFFSIIALIFFVITCFSNSDDYTGRTVSYLIAFPNDKRTKSFKAKHNVFQNSSNLSKAVSNYITARVKAPPITIISFFIPWLALHIVILYKSLSCNQSTTNKLDNQTNDIEANGTNQPLNDITD